MKLKTIALLAAVAFALVGWVWKASVSSEGAQQGANRGALGEAELGVALHSEEIAAPKAVPSMTPGDRMSLASSIEGRGFAPEVDDAPDAFPGSSTGATLTVRVQWRDQQPAEGVALLVSAFDRRRYRQADRWVITDAAGQAQVEALAPGKYTVQADRGGSLEVELGKEEDKAETLVLKGAFDVQGTVRDGEGRAVAGAEVVVASRRFDWRGAKRVAISDAGGGSSPCAALTPRCR
jgi:hypothetical protein